MSRSEWESVYSDAHESDNDNPHVITINLNSAKLNQALLSTGQATASNFQATLVHGLKELAIAASSYYTPGDGEAQRLRIITRSASATDDKLHAHTDRWL
jgi:hypothetical protein